MTLREAIDARHSVRAYKNQPLTEDIVKTLEEQITICNKKGKLHIQLILNEPKAFQGTLAKYGKFRNVSNYIVMAGQTSNDLDERIDKLNQADSMIFSTENFLNENGDKLPADQRPAIDSALQQLKDAHKNGDIAAIDTAMNNLNQVMQTASRSRNRLLCFILFIFIFVLFVIPSHKVTESPTKKPPTKPKIGCRG